jgi:hypothetical protein
MGLVTVAVFEPPGAVRQLESWRQRHAEALAAIPPDEVRFDVGRAVVGGDFARVLVEECHVPSFGADP